MNLLSVLIFVVLFLAFPIAGTAIAGPGSRPLTVSDMLAVEGTGAALAGPEGRWIYYERVRPYDQITDYSFRTYAYQKSGHQVWRHDLRGGGTPERLPGLDQDSHTWLQEASPSGRFLSLMQYRFGDLRLVSYDTRQETAVTFGPVPAFSRTGEHNPVWLHSDEIIYAALPEGDAPMATSVRAHTGRMLMKAWQDAWRGDRVTANEVRTRPVDASEEPEEGLLVRANASTGVTSVMAEGLFADLRVSPDGAWLAALSVSKPRGFGPEHRADADPRRYRLVIFDLTTGASVRLAPDLEFFPYTLAWSPDSGRVLAYGWRKGEDVRDGRFHVIDIWSGKVTRYEHRGLDLVSERERGWLQRPERAAFLGKALAVFARPVPKGDDHNPRFTFRDFHAEDLPRADWFALSPDGTSGNLTSGLAAVSGVPVHAGNGHLTVLAADGVYRLWEDGRRETLLGPVEGGLRHLPSGTFATRREVSRPDFSHEALFAIKTGHAERIIIAGLADGAARRHLAIDLPAGEATPLAGTLEGGAVLLRAESGQESALILAKPDGPAPLIELARLNRHLRNVDPGTWKLISYRVEDPQARRAPRVVESCVLLPPGYDGIAPVPLVVDVYPDARPRCRTDSVRITYPDPDSPYIWAGRGYAYARLTAPSDLIRTEDGPIAGLDEVIEAGVSALVQEGIADPDRLVLTGFSQGGVSSLYVAAQSHRFKAVIAMNSWADFASHYFGSHGILSYLYGLFGGFSSYEATAGSDFGLGHTPFDDPDAYNRNSPVFLARDIDAPVMLVHTDMDGFPIYQFDEMYGALKRAGKDARYVRYWGEGHGLSSPANIHDLWERIDAFLAEQGVDP